MDTGTVTKKENSVKLITDCCCKSKLEKIKKVMR